MINLYSRLVWHNGKQNLFRVIEMSAMAVVNNRPFHRHTEQIRCIGKTIMVWVVRSGKDTLGRQETTRIVDPLKTTIIAPAKPAVPLINLPDEQLVTRSPYSYD